MEVSERIKTLLPSLKPLKAPKDLTKSQIEDMLYKMCAIREFDSRVKDLWMAGEIYGMCHAYVGAEAIAVGACAAINKEDYISSTHRGHGHTLAKGAPIKAMMAELFGKYEGLNKGKGGSMHIADIGIGMLGATGIVGSGMPHAVGAALSSKTLDNNTVAICFHGDGATNQGVWHESMNLAAAWNLPVIFLTENNQYAITTSLASISKETHLYKRAEGYGIEGVQVDGFNVFDVYKAVKKAVDKARKGGGPTLIEARFLRMVGHFVADAQEYRDEQEAADVWNLCPVNRMKKYLVESGTLTQEKVDTIEKNAKNEVEEAILYSRNECSEPPEDTLFDDLYANGEYIG